MAADIVVVLSDLCLGYSVFKRSVLFEIEIPCILLFLNRNKNSQTGPNECTLSVRALTTKLCPSADATQSIVQSMHTDPPPPGGVIQTPKLLHLTFSGDLMN